MLSTPSLTGITRAELDALTDRVGHVQDARNERHRHRRRGGERLPGARGGVFTQKSTNTERVLAAVLYLSKLTSQDVITELLEVSRRTVGDVVCEVGPILTQEDYKPIPAGVHYATAAEPLASLIGNNPPTTRPR